MLSNQNKNQHVLLRVDDVSFALAVSMYAMVKGITKGTQGIVFKKIQNFKKSETLKKVKLSS